MLSITYAVIQLLQKKTLTILKVYNAVFFFLVSYDTKSEVILRKFTVPRTTLLEPVVYNVRRGWSIPSTSLALLFLFLCLLLRFK